MWLLRASPLVLLAILDVYAAFSGRERSCCWRRWKYIATAGPEASDGRDRSGTWVVYDRSSRRRLLLF
uniref:Putative secreted protein n=1 Tax=Anopheles triannulatus TaxID=58253 RepID=A0A2M4B6G9_9DIPT